MVCFPGMGRFDGGGADQKRQFPHAGWLMAARYHTAPPRLLSTTRERAASKRAAIVGPCGRLDGPRLR